LRVLVGSELLKKKVMTKGATMLKKLLLLLIVGCFLTTFVPAANGPKKTRPPRKMIDAAGRVHVRSMNRITEAQRKAAAHRRKANREKGARARMQNRTGEVKQ
jgi:hypothetical protein